MKEQSDNRLETIHESISAVFNTSWNDELVELNGGGSSSKLFKFKVEKKHYVLRLMGLDAPIQDRIIQIKCANKGAELKIAPECYFADVEQGILIMDYIEMLPFSKEVVLKEMPGLLNKLHNEADFPEPYCVVFPYMTDFIGRMIKITPSQQFIDYSHSIQEMMHILSHHRESASCHNDLNSENILYNGKQLVLIDFEAAGEEDPYFDLATICQQNCFDSKEEHEFLTAYLKREPQNKDRSKLLLMKQISYCYHALHFFEHAYNAGIKEYHGNIPSFKEWHQGRKEAKYNLDTAQDWMLYAMVVLHQSLDDMATPTFRKAVEYLI